MVTDGDPRLGQDGATAVIEYLDQEPEPRGGPRWEALIGLFLLAGLLAVVGWGWWSDQAKQAAYRKAGQAALTGDWEAAAGGYRAAGDYADARKRELEALLARRVLRGLLALRTEADPPGLYRHDGIAWRLLPGSDSQSKVYTSCADGTLLYDSPRPDRATPGSTSRPYFDPGYRRLLAAKPGATQFSEIEQPAVVGTDYYTCIAGRFWLSRSTNWAADLVLPSYYEPLDRVQVADRQAQTPAWPTPPSNMFAPIAGISPDGRLLLHRHSSVDVSGGPITTIYLAEPGAAGLREVVSRRGALYTSRFSPDSRYLLLVFTERDSADQPLTNLLLDLSDGSEIALNEEMGQSSALWYYDRFSVATSSFLQSKARRGQLLLFRQSDDHFHAGLLDPGRPEPIIPDISAEGTRQGPGFLHEEADGTLVLSWQNNEGAAGVVLVDPRDQVLYLPIRRGSNANLITSWVRGERLIWLVQENSGQQSVQFAYYSLPLDKAGDPNARPGKLYSAKFTSLNESNFFVPWQVGDEALIYSTGEGTLHARTYDGATDIVLEQSGVTLYSPDIYDLLRQALP